MIKLSERLLRISIFTYREVQKQSWLLLILRSTVFIHGIWFMWNPLSSFLKLKRLNFMQLSIAVPQVLCRSIGRGVNGGNEE